ncbi:MAG: hypothetical protein EBQ99_11230, partial [Planctomycetes bacterium]|nr:hypothetical protein [Planctomycetota bacterium]
MSSVALTLTTHASGNGTGAALSTRTLGATVSGSPFSSWLMVDEVLPAGVKSVVLTGQADRWGLDAFGVATGCPAPTSASDDCNANGLSDACEISRGLVDDCNRNGKPDACDISGVPPVAGAVQWR